MHRSQVHSVADRISKQALSPFLGICTNIGSESNMGQ